MLNVIFSILAGVGIILIMFGTYEEVFQHRKKTLILGAAMAAVSMLYFAIQTCKKGVDKEFLGAVILFIFFVAMFFIAVLKKEE